MRQLRKFVSYGRTVVLDYMDIVHVERFSYSVPVLHLLSHNSESSERVNLCCLRHRSHWAVNSSQPEYVHQICYYKKIIPSNSYSTSNRSTKESSNTLVENQTDEKTAVSSTIIENVKETSKTMFWCGIILIGLSFAVSVFYVVITELFSSNSPHRIYSKALKYVANDERVLNEMGDQLKGFGEETRRGRRQHVSHVEYNKDGRNYLRMKFYVKGNRGNGSVNLEMVENDKGEYEYRYMFVVVDSDPNLYKKTIILEDNRGKYESVGQVGSSLQDVDSMKELDLSLK